MPALISRQIPSPRSINSVENGTKVTTTSSCGLLVNAARKGNVDIIRFLIYLGADVNESYDGVTPLLAAAVAGQEAAMMQLLENGASPTARDKEGCTIFKLLLDNGHYDLAEMLIEKYPDLTVTDPRLPQGEKWLREQFKEISDNVKDPKSKPNEEVLEYLISGDLPREENRSVSDIYWEHILLRYIGDVPLDIKRNYSRSLHLSLMGTFNEFFTGHEGIKESARLLNSKLPTTAYTIEGTVVEGDGGWVTERWSYRDAYGINVRDGIDSFLIDSEKGKIMVKMINYNVEKNTKS
ncbi:isoform 2 of ankyrin repeat domain-containing protein 42 [Aspergillus udagawae]|uniref:Uncharacterized protein n=1 Tax=Aspergillus udagawae TaxID=91492 RepID=A0A8H3RQY8_9EURO|nr:uncharacterized protein Aud_006691 [Aspergillus udagawae]GFF34561.1 isoform 2 of ankyrin repeat domain-containing protein 42 [Aspergillus udagawae]GFG13498.1 isoform 2 of ankyrin repeat domain-containing protein 42 [Aspergillus udagawae]GFG21291.1 isoform 2 of ankyrin repeat domain-containing protein 42 [Aspergillus udagawae]GIC90258.1 hypothetical protein Aud_006691 [Aspergillus udagawae]